VEEVLVSFAGEPGRDDGNLPPANIVVPDDARELDRDVLAYHREQRARRRRQRMSRVFGPLTRNEYGGHAAILPLIVTVVALSMLAGAMLSVITISPASAPTVPKTPAASSAAIAPPIPLPAGTVQLDGKTVPVRSLVDSALILVPANCQCGPTLQRVLDLLAPKQLPLYFVASGAAMRQLTELTKRYGDGRAKALYDPDDVLGAALHPVGVTYALVGLEDTAAVQRNLSANFQLKLGPGARRVPAGSVPSSR
jgi:hypothetical protein